MFSLSPFLGRMTVLPGLLFFAAIVSAQTALAQTVVATPPTIQIRSAQPNDHRALRELDRFLDHHPLMEDDLRLRPGCCTDLAYLRTHTELRDFLRMNPTVAPNLKIHPRYFLYRALLRESSVPLHYSEIAQLKELFDAQVTLERALSENPELIRDPGFLAKHLRLRDYLSQKPTLGHAFLPPPAHANKNT